MKDTAVYRYSEEELISLVSKYDNVLGEDLDCKTSEDLRNMLLAGYGKRSYLSTYPVDPDKRKFYQKAYEGYQERVEGGIPFDILKKCTYDGNVEKKYFRSDDIIVHMLEAPFEDMPLYINSKENYASFFSKWRLEIGK